jgi:ABC-2 type transport system permease protein
MNWPALDSSLAIARAEYRRSLRAMVENRTQLFGFGIFLLFLLGMTVGGTYAAYTYGERIIDALPVLDGARGALAVAWLGPVALIAQRAVGKTARIEHEAGMLTTVPAPDVLGGLVLAEAARVLTVVAVPVVAVAGALALGIGAPAAFISIVVASLAVFATAFLAGHVVGVGIKIVVGQSELLTRYKSVIAVVAFLAYFVAVSSEAFGRALIELFGLLQNTPMAWFGDLLVAGIPTVSPSPLRIVGALALVAVGVPILLAVDVRAAERLWYADRAQPGTRTYEGTDSDSTLLSRIAAGPTRAVVTKIWRRTRRAPIRLIYVVYPLFFLFAPLQQAFATGEIPASLPVLLALYGVWAVGAAALNPLGDEGALLPVTLTTGVRGGQFVRGHVLAVVTIGLPLVAGATALAGFLSPLDPASWTVLVAVSAVLCVVGPVLALAIGTRFPRFGAVRVSRSREVVVPSKTAFACYTLVVAVGALGGAVALIPGGAALLSSLIGFVAGYFDLSVAIGASVLRVGGGAVALALGLVAPLLAYRYVSRRFDSYTL